jgi:(p)ppGpp synthase/HD superfamily hydrolase
MPPTDGDLASFLADLPVSSRAATWAAAAHDGQTRLVDDAPFIVHPLEVALALHAGGYRDEVIAVALLHDVVEKARVPLADVEEAFGITIAARVDALSEDETMPDAEARKAALRDHVAQSPDDELAAVFAADKLVKARELRLGVAGDRLTADAVVRARAHYLACLAVLERRLPDHPFTEALRFELATQLEVPALAWLRPAGATMPLAS